MLIQPNKYRKAKRNYLKHTWITMMFFTFFSGLAQNSDGVFVLYDEFPLKFNKLPTQKANSCNIPVNKKFTIELFTHDSIHFDFSVVAFERFNETLIYSDLAYYYPGETANNGTIEFYFCVGSKHVNKDTGYSLDGGVVLVMNNRTVYDLIFDVALQKKAFNKIYNPEGNIKSLSGTESFTLWKEMLADIQISNFRLNHADKK